ncbi:hypothetical protein [Actomonas aquatica]|uniref:DUF1570 domain-containing protein n=1 Tax=Actomonas aquatica TaxID=2866162 RepID=A0ABZ1CF15_9BACT|nr:hypothetical protein [Opitutus sp. WL0086]WRQ90002.1 hypothetical protein K1X11_011340 [Opitutus sp. WL0086]
MPSRFSATRIVAPFPLIAVLLAANARGQETPFELNTSTVQLREFAITERRAPDAPEEVWDWRSGTVDDIEFISSASEERTEKLVTHLGEFANLLHWLIPQWPRPADPPLRLIICGSRGTFAELRPVTTDDARPDTLSAYYHGYRHSYAVIDDNDGLQVWDWQPVTFTATQISDRPFTNRGTGPFLRFAPTTDFGQMGFGTNTTELLEREYVRHLLLSQGWSSPAWFTEGMARLVATAKVDGDRVRIGRLDTVQMGEFGQTASELSLRFHRQAMKPLMELFTVNYDSPDYLNARGSKFSDQSLAFVHYSLYGAKGRYQAALLNWLGRLQIDAPSEAAFRECFGTSTSSFGAQLRGYFDGGLYRSPVTSADDLPTAPELVIGPADPAQVAVFKAETQALAGRAVEASALLESSLANGFANFALHVARAELALAARDYETAAAALATASSLDEPLSDEYRAARLELEVRSEPALDSATAKRLLIDALQLQQQLPGQNLRFTTLLAEIFLRSPLKPDEAFVNLLETRAANLPPNAELTAVIQQVRAKAGGSFSP